MAVAFLLRFQEECLSPDLPGIVCGTKTSTKILREQPNDDLWSTNLTALSRSAAAAGTSTKTGVPRETPDVDVNRSGLYAIPGELAVAATKTVTFVKREEDD